MKKYQCEDVDGGRGVEAGFNTLYSVTIAVNSYSIPCSMCQTPKPIKTLYLFDELILTLAHQLWH